MGLKFETTTFFEVHDDRDILTLIYFQTIIITQRYPKKSIFYPTVHPTNYRFFVSVRGLHSQVWQK